MPRCVRPFEERAFVVIRDRRTSLHPATRVAEVLAEEPGRLRVRVWRGKARKWCRRSRWIPSGAGLGRPALDDARLNDIAVAVRRLQQAAFARATRPRKAPTR